MKQVYSLLILIFSFFAFLYMTQPSYIGYTIQADSVNVFQTKIDVLQSLQQDPDKLEILQALDIDIPSTISVLIDYDSQIQTIEQDVILNDTEKSTMISNLETQVDVLLSQIPKLIVITDKISDFPATPPSDITPEMLPADIDSSRIEETLYMQDQVDARTDIKVFSISTFYGNEILGTHIKKAINAPPQDGYVLEIIPVIASEHELNFLGEYEVVNYDPLILAIKMSNGLALYSYTIQKDISTSISQIQTAVVPYEVAATAPVIDVKCGDGICTEFLEDEITCPEDCARKFPWLFIISIVVIIIAGIFLTHIFRHKLKALFRKKGILFKAETDKQNLKNYIKKSINEGIEEEEIRNVLLAKGWTENQVDFIFNEIKQEKLGEYRESTPIESETEKLKTSEESSEE